MRSILRLAACAALVACSSSSATRRRVPQTPAPQTPAPTSSPRPAATAPVVEEYAGLYAVTNDEDHFVPCGIKGVGDGWALKFRNARAAIFIGRQTVVRGYGPLTHFIRVRGTLDSSSRYNRGFQTHQLTVDTVLDVREQPQPCPSYEDLPSIWPKVRLGSRQLRGATFSADSRVAAVMTDEGKIAIWNVDRGEMIKELRSDERFDPQLGYKIPMLFSRDKSRLYVGGSDGKVRVWSVSSGLHLYTLSHVDSTPGYNDIGHNSMIVITALSLDPKETMLAVTSNWIARIWSLKTRQPLAEYDRSRASWAKAFFDNDGNLLVADNSGTITSYREPGGPPEWSAKSGARASQYATRSADGKWLAINHWGDSLFLWSVPRRARGPALNIPATFGGVGGVAFSPDGKIVATGGGYFGLYLWDANTGAPIRSFQHYPQSIWYAWFLPDGKSIVTYSWSDDVFRIAHLDSAGDLAAPSIQTDSLAILTGFNGEPRTIAAVVKGPDNRAISGAEAMLINGDAPDSVLRRAITSSGGYFSFNGVRFPHVIVCVRKSGFQDGFMYLHQRRYDPGVGQIDLDFPPTLRRNGVWRLPIRPSCDNSPAPSVTR
ncbi:MAG TPA: WD40 repeat domain-containing protein [Gemmatimonadaceae bacterium]|nr:WD40 repeat domain-containing protein [Gemmatimonadaceae bacterium]